MSDQALPYADPIRFAREFWPDVTFYRQQREILYSLVDNRETVVPAGNKLGKDYVAGFAVLWYFLTRNPCRIVTTSAKDDHLRVLWGEIHNFIQTARCKFEGLVVNQRELRKVINGKLSAKSYVVGMVASPDTMAAMQGHHIAATGDGIPRTLFVSDESSNVPDGYYPMVDPWMDRALIFGNPWPCENFFKRAVKGNPKTKDRGGDLASIDGVGLKRKVIRIKAEDSPNIRYALAEIRAGKKPSGRVVVPGVKQYREYLENRRDWDPIQQCVSLDADFYEGAENLWFPPDWLNLAEQHADALVGVTREAKAIGIDPAEGGDETAWAVGDELGLIELIHERTPNTATVVNRTLELISRYEIPPEMVLFDRGGGGKEHADALRSKGLNVRTIGFNESVSAPIRKRGVIEGYNQRISLAEERYAYRNRRAEMHGVLRNLLNPQYNEVGEPTRKVFAIPRKYVELRRQLAPIPMWYDEEGRLYLPPKHLKSDAKDNGDKITIEKLIGCSPDQSDALILMAYCLITKPRKFVAGAV